MFANGCVRGKQTYRMRFKANQRLFINKWQLFEMAVQ
jgi:hypothetical protein